MLDSFVAKPNPTPNVQGFFSFLSFVDQVREPLGLNAPQIVELEKLRSLPIGSLGRTLADFLDANHFTPFTSGPRRKQLHDLVHVLTSYGTDPIGEAEVQAFLLGGKFRLVHVTLGLGLVRAIHKQIATVPGSEPTHLVRERLRQAYQRGKESQLDVDTWRPEEQWELPLTQVQALLKL